MFVVWTWAATERSQATLLRSIRSAAATTANFSRGQAHPKSPPIILAWRNNFQAFGFRRLCRGLTRASGAPATIANGSRGQAHPKSPSPSLERQLPERCRLGARLLTRNGPNGQKCLASSLIARNGLGAQASKRPARGQQEASKRPACKLSPYTPLQGLA